jgi:Bacterial protein of unknown function (DUF839)
MSLKHTVRYGSVVVAGASLVLGSSLASAAPPGTSHGPRTTVDPYVIPLNPTDVQIKSLLTVNDLPTGGTTPYDMVGIPDGLGAFPDGSGKVTMVSNHELTNTVGIARANGKIGTFVSRYTLDPATYDVTDGADLIPAPASLDYSGTPAVAFSRFCSGDLASPNALYNYSTGNGYNGRLYFAGEESNVEGRLVGHDPVNGDAKVLTAPGWMAWENFLLADTEMSDKTIGIGNYDVAGGIDYIYVGTKTNTGSKWDKAGLTNGTIYGFKVAGTATDALFRSSFGKNNPQTFSLTTALPATTGAAEQAAGIAQGALQLDRTEDGAWDPSNPNDYYFVTTGSTPATPTHGRGGLWRMRFVDRTNPSLGGTLTLLLDGTEPGPLWMPDNFTIDSAGHIVLLEDPGADNYVARVFAYDIATQVLRPIATFDPALFAPGPTLLTNDEESSGIIPAPAGFGANTFLFDAQVHTASGLTNPTAQVERGQYMLMTVDFTKVFAELPPDVPEAPAAILLSATAVGIVGIALMMNRRRRAKLIG